MNNTIEVILIIGLMAFGFGLLMSYVSRKYGKNEDPKIESITNVLPDNNCGGCGFGGCEQFAQAVVLDPTIAGHCAVGGKETADKISQILGIHISVDKIIAFVRCVGGNECKNRFEYEGIKSCSAVSVVGNIKECSAGCLGFGDCIKVCHFNAIEIINDVAIIDPKKCVGCGKCVAECPKSIIILNHEDSYISVACSSHDKPKEKAAFCKTGCIGCGICAKVCTRNAITMDNNLPLIDNKKCEHANACIEKCPRKVIKKL